MDLHLYQTTLQVIILIIKIMQLYDGNGEYGYKGTLFVIDVTDRNNMTTIIQV